MRKQSTPGASAGEPSKSAFKGHVDWLPTTDGDGYVSANVAAEMLGTSANSLATCRATGQGLLGQVPYYKTTHFNGRVLYLRSDVEAHVARFGKVDSRWGKLANPSSEG